MLRKNFKGRRTLRRLSAGVAISDSEYSAAQKLLCFTKGGTSSTSVPDRKAKNGISRERVDAHSKLFQSFQEA